jgi:hypothetical protein
MSNLDTAEYRRIALIAAGVDPSQIPSILDTATWRRLMIAALNAISQGGGGGPTTFDASAIVSGVLDNARVNFEAPAAIGSTTPAAGSFTTLSASDTFSATGQIRFGSGSNNVVLRRGDGVVFFSGNYGTFFDCQAREFRLGHSGTGGPVSFFLDGNGVIEQRNATNPQTFRLYTTIGGTGNVDYERLFLKGQTGGAFQIGTERGGTGLARALEFQIDGTTRVAIGSAVTITGGLNPDLLTLTDGGLRVQGGQSFFVFGNGTYPSVSNVVNNWNNNLALLVRRLSTGTGDFVDFQDSSSVSKLKIDKDGYVVLPTSGGVKIGTATNQLLGFYGATPVDQPATVADPSGVTTDEDVEARTAINAIIDRLQELGLIA